MRWTVLILALGLSGAAHAMPASEFLARADALRAKGPFALMSDDLPRLKQAVVDAGGQLRAERLAAAAAHRPPLYCPPGGHGSLNADELTATIRAMPPAARAKTELKDAMRVVMIRKFPCPA